MHAHPASDVWYPSSEYDRDSRCRRYARDEQDMADPDRTVGDSALLTVRLDLINRLPDVDVQHGDAASLPFSAWASTRRGSRMSI